MGNFLWFGVETANIVRAGVFHRAPFAAVFANVKNMHKHVVHRAIANKASYAPADPE